MANSDSTRVTVTIKPDTGFTFDFESLQGAEELGRPFEYNLELSCTKPMAGLLWMLGSTVAIGFSNGSDTRYVHGIVARARYDGLSRGAYRYRLELRPWIWLLSRRQDSKIFQNMSAWNIISQVFRDAGFSDFQDKRQNSAGSQVLEYCVQYNETSLDFVTRLAEKFGIYYYYTHSSSAHTLVFADDPSSHAALANALPFKRDQTEYRGIDSHVWDFTSDLLLQSGAVAFRDYNFTTPGADLTTKSIQQGKHPYGTFEVYEYPGPYGIVADGEKIAQARMSQIHAQRQVVHGTSNERGLYAGCKFKLSDFPDKAQNIEYLVIAASISLDAAETTGEEQGGTADTFRCSFTAVPGTIPFRIDERTPWPMISGPQTARVVGEAGEEITTDQYGRIKVKFFWDRSAAQDQNASCWIRVAQIWAGASWGGMYIPRIGQEVVVEFLDGNPDRPLVTGCVYNATNTIPYAQPDNKTRSSIKTNSSSGGGGFNELRFEDKKGSEEVFFQAQKDYNKVVLNSETVKITQDTTTTVDKGNRSVTVSQGNDSLTVSQGSRSVTVSQSNDSLTVSQGNHTITISAGSSTIEAGQSITLKVGSNSLTIDSTGISLNGAKIALQAQTELTANGGGKMTLQAGMIAIN